MLRHYKADRGALRRRRIDLAKLGCSVLHPYGRIERQGQVVEKPQGCADSALRYRDVYKGGRSDFGLRGHKVVVVRAQPRASVLLELSDGYYVGGDHGTIGLIEGYDGGKVFGQEAAELAALFETHVYDLEGHALAAIIAQQGGGLEIA